MLRPTPDLFNNPEYYTQKMPVEVASSRLWQLVYGEFRAPMLAAVLRHKIRTYRWVVDYSAADAIHVIKLLQVWKKISDNRKVEWPELQKLVDNFTERLALHLYAADFGKIINPSLTDKEWIDDDAVWNELVIQPYHTL